MHQILTIDADTGKLVLNEQGDFWADFNSETDPVRMVMTFGKSRVGKSVIASMMGCEMTGDTAMLFPTFHSSSTEARTDTEGIWASRPFSLPDDQGVMHKYMLLDMQSIDFAEPFQNKLSFSMKQDQLHKILAMMSEVVSTFVFTLSSTSLGVSDWQTLGLAMAETRKNMVLNSRNAGDEGAVQDEELNLKSHNKPALLLVPRQATAVKQDLFEVDTAALDDDAKGAKDLLQGDQQSGRDIYTLLERNFKEMTNGAHAAEKIPFSYTPVPTVRRGETEDGGIFWWQQPGQIGRPAYPYEQKGACTVYNSMKTDRWRCTDGSGAQTTPSGPAMYQLLMGHMVKMLKTEAAPVRRVSWKGQQYPTDLTGDRIRTVLLTGVEEMNAIGPLPRTELWRKIMEDRCKGEIKEYLDFTYGEKSGMHEGEDKKGLLFVINTGLDYLASGQVADINEMKNRWGELQKSWLTMEPMVDGMNNWFGIHTLLEAVKEECLVIGQEHAELLDETWQTKEAEWSAVLANKERQLAEEALRQAQSGSFWKAIWDEWKIYILVGSVMGLFALYLLMRVWRGVNSTCRVCASCCGDWGDTTTTTKIITTHNGGRHSAVSAVERGPAVPFAAAVAVPASGVASSSAGEDPHQRLEKLGNTIKELQKRASR